MDFPEDLKYSETHEWVRVEGDEAVIGVTDYAQDELGDVTYVEFPEEGESFVRNSAFGVIETEKASEDLLMPISGEVIEVNTLLADSYETINEDPYGDGWFIRVVITSPKELDDLMDAEAYKKYIEEEA